MTVLITKEMISDQTFLMSTLLGGQPIENARKSPLAACASTVRMDEVPAVDVQGEVGQMHEDVVEVFGAGLLVRLCVKPREPAFGYVDL